jgi:glycosyltransferase involved in cell wall biosynthesis
VVANYANAEFVVVGEGPDRESLERLIDELKINSKVSLVGRRDDMPSVYRSFDVMVSSSRKEGLPVSILEGMATGLPVVATTVGEVPRLIRGGETGLLVPPDKPLLLARAIAELLVDREYRERLGCAAKTLIEREFSAERMAAGYLRVYEDSMTIHADKAQSKGIME